MKRIKQIYKTSKRVIKKRSCHLVPKVWIDLPFEGRKVEGSLTVVVGVDEDDDDAIIFVVNFYFREI